MGAGLRHPGPDRLFGYDGATPSSYHLCIRWPDTLAQFVFPWIERVFYPINGLWKVPNHT